YLHMFYGVNLHVLRALFGSGDADFADELSTGWADELAEIDEWLTDADDEFPGVRTLLSDIMDGQIRHRRASAKAGYGYALKLLCWHVGAPIMHNVCCIADQPFSSQLLKSGPPIPIPPADDFPAIGFLEHHEIASELARLQAALDAATDGNSSRAKPGWLGAVLRWLGVAKAPVPTTLVERSAEHELSEDLLDDMRAYAATLQDAQALGCALVSFYH
ncbi:MAG: hypothetical protein KDA47_20775, partial [Planctomycetales bacterium]|nr:hypothetical protein [Planctomycetales bacterium]